MSTGVPKTILTHFSCFREVQDEGEDGTEERRQDFEKLAVSFATNAPATPEGKPVRMLVFTRALDSMRTRDLSGFIEYAFDAHQAIGDHLLERGLIIGIDYRPARESAWQTRGGVKRPNAKCEMGHWRLARMHREFGAGFGGLQLASGHAQAE